MTFRVPIALCFVAISVAFGGVVVSEKISNEAMTGVARGEMALFTLLVGFCSFMLKEVQAFDPKDSLSSIGLDRLRGAQDVASRRLFWMIMLGIVGFGLSSLCSFQAGELSGLVKSFALPASFVFMALMISLTFGYLPRLYFDLKRAREHLADLIRANEARKSQLSVLSDGLK